MRSWFVYDADWCRQMHLKVIRLSLAQACSISGDDKGGFGSVLMPTELLYTDMKDAPVAKHKFCRNPVNISSDIEIYRNILELIHAAVGRDGVETLFQILSGHN